jgi:hypothetical protein
MSFLHAHIFDRMFMLLSDAHAKPTLNKLVSLSLAGGGEGGAAVQSVAEDLPAVEIGVHGRFKYVLIEVATSDGGCRHVVRGVLGAQYHMDAAQPTLALLQGCGASFTVLGGGRIEHDPTAKTIQIYGHSYGFPWQVCVCL